MRSIRLSLIACAAGAALVQQASAQDLPKPGKEHASLKRMEGTYDVIVEGGKGTMTYKMGLGGLWLLGELNGEFRGTKFEGKGMDTYDPATKKYRTIWADSMSTAPMLMEGNFDKDNKVLTLTGEGPGPDGKTAKFKSTTELKDEDTIVFSLFQVASDGKERAMLKITYKRKK